MLISYILPFYHKAKLFKAVLPLNDCFRSPSAEVICVLDEPSEETELLNIIRANPDIRFKLIVNDWDHEWRPPSIAINVGVRHAASTHIVLASPESIIRLPAQNYLEFLIANNWRDARAGSTWNVADFDPLDPIELIRSKLLRTEATSAPINTGCGFLLCQKFTYECIYGMNEARTAYGGDDDEIRSHIVRFGNRLVIEPNIKIFHPWHETNTARIGGNHWEDTPHIVLIEQKDTWGKAFHRVAWDWRKQ
jgi:hypothetical protein